jgi:cytochrome c oxidase cbb3-type subunit 3/ubiquinol-cytochrome c reductase cytochrome c subunit
VLLALCLSCWLSPRASAARTTPVESGKQLYARYCQLCHAANATGYAADNAPSLVSREFLSSADDAFLARGIRLGRPNTAMAAYGKERGGPLDEQQIAEIVRFLRKQGPAAKKLPELKLTGDAARGGELYQRECQSCHGSTRKTGNAPQLHNSEFLAAASPAFLQHAIQKGRPPTKMPAFAQKLSAEQIADLVAWLQSLRTQPPVLARGKAVVPSDLPLLIHPKGAAPEFTLREDRFVAAAQVNQALAAQRRMIIIDARSPSDWIQFHIPGSVPIPYYDTAQLERVPNDDTWVIAYCACPHHASGEVVDALRKRGFKNTAVLDEGILFWRQQGFPLEGEAVTTKGSAPPGPAPKAR